MLAAWLWRSRYATETRAPTTANGRTSQRTGELAVSCLVVRLLHDYQHCLRTVDTVPTLSFRVRERVRDAGARPFRGR